MWLITVLQENKMKGFLITLVVGIIFAGFNYTSYQIGYRNGFGEVDKLYFNNDQIEVMFKSDLEACNIKWGGCGIGVTRVLSGTFYKVEPKDMSDKSLKLYLEGYDLRDMPHSWKETIDH